MRAFNSGLDQIPLSPIPIGTPISFELIAFALLFLPTILGASNIGASNQTIFGTIEHDFHHLGTDIVGILHHHHGAWGDGLL